MCCVWSQAVSRIHRIGQLQKTFVHSFVVGSSIEENVFKLNRERAASQGMGSPRASREEELSTRCQLPTWSVPFLFTVVGCLNRGLQLAPVAWPFHRSGGQRVMKCVASVGTSPYC